MHLSHTSAKIQPKNLKQHFDWGARALWAPLATPLNQVQLQLPAARTQTKTSYSLFNKQA